MLKIKIMRYGYDSLIVKFSCSDSDLFHEAVESFKGHLYEDERRYDPDGRRWLVKDCDNFIFWCEYARENLCADVEDSRNTYRQQQEQTRREEYKRPRPPKVDELSKAFETLHLRESAPVRLIEAARRLLLVEVHPDKEGGNHEAAVMINRAADEILRERRKGAA
jgi:hypothetical protein